MNNWDQRQFDRTLREYMNVNTKRTLPQIVNTKAYYIWRKALWFTQKADVHRMKAQLGQFVSVNRIGKSGKVVKKREVVLTKGEGTNAPLAALIINARRGKRGDPGLYGSRMARAIREMLSARFKSAAFIKSGFIQGIKDLEPFADKSGRPPIDNAAKQLGRPKGDAKPAKPGWRLIAQMVNNASAQRDTKGALLKYGGRGLDRAFKDETASMREYIERKMKPDAAKFNAGQR